MNRLEIIVVNECELPQAIRQQWPTLEVVYRSHFYSLYATSLTQDVTEQQAELLTMHYTIDTIADYSHDLKVRQH